MKKAISVKDLTYRWHKNQAPVLDIPDLEVKAGEKAFLMGPSGSGKTTLLGVIGGVLVPEQGSVVVNDQDLRALSGSHRDAFRADHVGFVFQMFNLIPYLSVLENVLLPLRFSPVRRGRLANAGLQAEAEGRRLLHALGLHDERLLSRPVTALSVGQQQRVASARALIGSPELIIADEPTSALDFDARESFLKLIFEECERASTTLLFVSHDRSLISLFDRTILLAEVNRASQVLADA